jgi:hypothetical protein
MRRFGILKQVAYFVAIVLYLYFNHLVRHIFFFSLGGQVVDKVGC